MQKSSVYNYCVEPFTEDYTGNLSWGNIGNLLLRCASLHAGEHGFGYSQMIELRHAWVLSRLVIEIDKMPSTGDSFSIETWVDKLYHQFTERHFSILNSDGFTYGHATSIWSLIDISTRQPADLGKLPNGGLSKVLIPERPIPISPMRSIRMRRPKHVLTHKASYSDIDINGHVNSIRYIELLLDSIPFEQLKSIQIKRIEMAYRQEAYCGDILRVYQDEDLVESNRRTFEVKVKERAVAKGCILCV